VHLDGSLLSSTLKGGEGGMGDELEDLQEPFVFCSQSLLSLKFEDLLMAM
jgi:hypothetical protein